MPDTQSHSAAEIIGELEIITQVWISFEHQQAIRWRKNFFTSLLIASIFYWLYPSLIWIWGVVLTFSTLSLIAFVIMHCIIQRKLKQTYQHIERLKYLEKQSFKKYHKI